MVFQQAKIILFVVVIAFCFSGCFKPEEFSHVPAIRFKSFEQLKDSGKMVVSFTDGDGDIGVLAFGGIPLDSSENLFLEYYEKDDGQGFVQGLDTNNLPIVFKYLIKDITPQGQNKALKGEIEVTLEPWFYNFTSPESDTLLYKIVLIDRAGNRSNVLETPEIIR